MNADPQASGNAGGGISRRDFLRGCGAPNRPIPAGVPARQPAARFSLGGLADLPEKTLADLVPVFRRDLKITIKNQVLEARNLLGDRVGQVPLSEIQDRAIRLFDGRHNLGQIAAGMKSEELPERDAWNAARQLFVDLAASGICHPAGPPPRSTA